AQVPEKAFSPLEARAWTRGSSFKDWMGPTPVAGPAAASLFAAVFAAVLGAVSPLLQAESSRPEASEHASNACETAIGGFLNRAASPAFAVVVGFKLGMRMVFLSCRPASFRRASASFLRE